MRAPAAALIAVFSALCWLRAPAAEAVPSGASTTVSSEIVTRDARAPAERRLDVPGAPPGPNDYNVVFVSMTNTRADHLGVYGYERNTSPRIDVLAKRSLAFKSVFSHASWTLPVAVSLFTSQYPFTHGLLNREDFQPVPPTTPTFVDVLKQHGYLTAAFVGNRDYSPKFGHTSRFDETVESVMQGEAEDWKAYGVFEKTVPLARKWLREHSAGKFFLLVQGYDTHCPFASPRENRQFDPGYKGKIDFSKCYWTFERTRAIKRRTESGEYVNVFPLKTKPAETAEFEVMFYPEDVRHMVALYDGEIFNADGWVGKLLEDIAELGLEKRTVVVIYSDHGDMFGKHGRFMRGGPLRGTFYDDVLHVPLIISHPDYVAQTVEGLGQVIDIAPTLLDLLGLPRPETFRGKSLRSLITGSEVVNTHVFAGAAYSPSAGNPFFRHRSVIASVRNQKWKLIVERLDLPEGPSDEFELYDLTRDAQELRSVVPDSPETLHELKKKLRAWLVEIGSESVLPGF